MGDTKPQLVISLHQMKLPVQRLGYIQMSYLPKVNPQTTQPIAKTVGCSSYTDVFIVENNTLTTNNKYMEKLI